MAHVAKLGSGGQRLGPRVHRLEWQAGDEVDGDLKSARGRAAHTRERGRRGGRGVKNTGARQAFNKSRKPSPPLPQQVFKTPPSHPPLPSRVVRPPADSPPGARFGPLTPAAPAPGAHLAASGRAPPW
eukprot:scaffold2509_cov107-Isochrysis_galbana.AAC.2